MKTVYFDMDGVITKYDYNLYVAEKPNQIPPFLKLGRHVFIDLEAEPNILAAFIKLYNKYRDSKDIQIKILTSIPQGLLQAEHTLDKYFWCNYHISQFNSNDFFCTSVPKHDAVSDSLWSLSENDILIDDYNKNLINWRDKGGTAIKCINNINSLNPDYDYIDASWSPDKIVEKIEWLLL